METLKTKRFVVRKSLVGKNQIIEVTFKSGKQVTYNHDKVYDIMKDKLETMNCFIKYKSYTSSTSIPVILRDKEIVQSLKSKTNNMYKKEIHTKPDGTKYVKCIRINKEEKPFTDEQKGIMRWLEQYK